MRVVVVEEESGCESDPEQPERLSPAAGGGAESTSEGRARGSSLHHRDGGQLLQNRRGSQSRRVNHQPVLQGNLQAVSQEGNQDMGFGALLVLVINGTNVQIRSLRSETRSPSGSVAHSASTTRLGLRWSDCCAEGNVHRVVRRLRVWFCRVERKSLARDRLCGCRQVNLDEPEGTTRFLLRSPDAQQQPISLG